MRKSTVLWLGLAIGAGVALFMTSQHVTDGRQKLSVVEYDIRKEEETLRVLQAEWSYLNQPERLEKLTAEYLPIAPMQGKQFVDIDRLEKAPPPPATEGPVVAATEETAIAPKTAPEKAAAPPLAKKEEPKPVIKPVVVAQTPKPKLETLKPQAVSKNTQTAKAAWKPPANNAAWSPKAYRSDRQGGAYTPPKTAAQATPVYKAPVKTAPAQKTQPKPQPVATSNGGNRDFNSMMKSLGVQ